MTTPTWTGVEAANPELSQAELLPGTVPHSAASEMTPDAEERSECFLPSPGQAASLLAEQMMD